MTTNSDFAEPSASNSSFTKTKNFKPVPGSNIYRIGPAYKSLAPSGRWNHNIRQHYGYRVPGNEENPNGFIRTFLCPEVTDQHGMIKVRCPECEDIRALTEKVELRKQKLLEEGKTEGEIDTILGAQKKYLKEHNLDKKHLVLAKNEQNEWGVLWLPWKALEALLARRKKIQAEEGIDILSTKDGCWLDFTREGEGFRTTYGCDVVTETVVAENGRKARVMKQDPLTDADKEAIRANCPDLTTVGTKLTIAQIERLVESRGDQEVAEAIFNEAWESRKGNREASPAVEASPKPQPKPEPVAVKPEAKPAPQKVVKVEEKDGPGPNERTATFVRVPAAEDDEEAQLLAMLAAAKAKKAAKVAAAAAPAPASDAMSDDQFLAMHTKKS